MRFDDAVRDDLLGKAGDLFDAAVRALSEGRGGDAADYQARAHQLLDACVGES